MLRSDQTNTVKKRLLESSLSSDSPTNSPKPKQKRKKNRRHNQMTSQEKNILSTENLSNVNTPNSNIPDLRIINNMELESELPDFAKLIQNNLTPEISDVMRGILLVLQKLDCIQTEIVSSNAVINKHESEIKQIKEKQTQNDFDIIGMKGSINLLNQQQIDNEVLVSGFKQLLSPEDQQQITVNLCKIYGVNSNCVRQYFTFNNSKNNETSSTLVVKFWDKQEQINLIKKVIENGPPTTNQLILGSVSVSHDKQEDNPLRCFGRLTMENVQISKILRQLKKEKKIHAMRYRNLCFHYQEKTDSQFSAVICLKEIELLKDKLSK